MDDVEMADSTLENNQQSTFNKISKSKKESKSMLPFIEKYSAAMKAANTAVQNKILPTFSIIFSTSNSAFIESIIS